MSTDLSVLVQELISILQHHGPHDSADWCKWSAGCLPDDKPCNPCEIYYRYKELLDLIEHDMALNSAGVGRIHAEIRE